MNIPAGVVLTQTLTADSSRWTARIGNQRIKGTFDTAEEAIKAATATLERLPPKKRAGVKNSGRAAAEKAAGNRRYTIQDYPAAGQRGPATNAYRYAPSALQAARGYASPGTVEQCGPKAGENGAQHVLCVSYGGIHRYYRVKK